jgi:hypothetical protein
MDINNLIKLAKSYDTVGLYHEADQIMMKLAQNTSAPKRFSREVVRVKFGDKELLILPPGRYVGGDAETTIEYKRYNYFRNLIYKNLSEGDIYKLRNVQKELNKYNLDATVDAEHDVNALRRFLVDFFNNFYDVEIKDGIKVFFYPGHMPNKLNEASFAINGESSWLINKVNRDSLANVIKVGANGKATLDPSSISLEGISRDQFDKYSKLLYDDEIKNTNNFIAAINKDYPEHELIKNGNIYTFKLRDKSSAAARETPKPGFVQGVTNVGDVFSEAKFNNYAMGGMASNIIIPNKKAYDDLLFKIKAATTSEGLNDLKSNLATYGLSITSEDNNTYTIRANTSGSAASQVQPLAAPKNQVQMSHPIADVNVQEYNLNRQKKQETNQDALRSEWNGYIQGDSFLQSLESRLKDIHNQVNPNNKSEVFNYGMIATIESKGSEYKPIIDMYKARKNNIYKNVGDLGPAQMYGTK